MTAETVKIEIPEPETAEMPNMEELLNILIDLNMSQSQQTISLLMNYMNDMEENFFSVLQELDTVKEQLANVQNTAQTRTVRNTLSELSENMGSKVALLQNQLKELKVSLNEKAAQLVRNYKNQGIKALNQVCGFLGIKETMNQLKDSLLDNAKNMQESMDKIDNVAKELRGVSTHVKNVGRAMAGKETMAVSEQKEKGFFYQMKRPYQSMKHFCENQAAKLEKGIATMERLEQSANKAAQKPSIIETLQTLKEERAVQKKATPKMNQEKEQKTHYKTERGGAFMADNHRVNEQLKEITEKLEQGIQGVFESEKYKEYLNTMSKFYNYSFNNTMLISLQKPDATLVAGYQAWQKNFERHVKKGEKGIRIIAPAPITQKEELEKLDPVTQEPMLDVHGKPIMEEIEIRIPTFKVISVFDVTQTEGKELPDLMVDELTGEVENYEVFMQALAEVAPVPIGYEEISDGAKGYFHLEEKRIALQEGMSEIQNTKTAIHEIAHAMLHDMDLNSPERGEGKDRKTKEVEAESIAYTVSQHYGIDTSDYSFGYVAGWSSDKELKELKSSLETIQKTSATLIQAIDARIADLQLIQEEKVEPIRESDVLVMMSGSMGSEYEIDKVTNMGLNEVQALLDEMAKQADESWDGNVHGYLEERGAELTPIMSSSDSQWDDYTVFYDLEYDIDTNQVTTSTELSLEQQTEYFISRMEFGNAVFSEEERELLVNYALKFANIAETKTLAMELRDSWENPDVRARYEIIERGRAEMKALQEQRNRLVEPSNEITLILATGETRTYLYPFDVVAVDIEEMGSDRTAVFMATDVDLDAAIAEFYNGYSGMELEKIIAQEYGIEWVESIDYEDGAIIKPELSDSQKAHTGEEKLLLGEEDSFGIYQLKKGEELHFHRFESLESLSRHGLSVEKENYELIYSAPLQAEQTFDDIFEQFNMFRPEDFTGHSLSVSDIVLIYKDGVNTAHYVDRGGFQEIPDFLELQAEHEVGQVTESAYAFADRYLMIHECDDGYDYTFYDKDYKEMDGGVYDNPDITLEEAVHIILTDDPFPNMERTPVDYEELDEKVEVANQISKPQARKEKVAPLSDRAEAMQELNGMSPADKSGTIEVFTQESKPIVTFYVAECMEFTDLGEYHDNLTLEEAIRLYESIPAERMKGIKGIGFTLHEAEDELYKDSTMAILNGNTIDVDSINHVDEFRNNQIIQEAVKEVIQRFPDAEVWDRETRVRERQETEKTLLHECMNLSVEIDQFCEDYDTYEYRDTIDSKEENIEHIYTSLYAGEVDLVTEWLQSVIDEEEPAKEVARAKALLQKVNDLVERREQNPLEKVEELEEANYNQIDGIINNVQPKKEEHTDASLSIMERLERNREIIAKESTKEKTEKKSERGME